MNRPSNETIREIIEELTRISLYSMFSEDEAKKWLEDNKDLPTLQKADKLITLAHINMI